MTLRHFIKSIYRFLNLLSEKNNQGISHLVKYTLLGHLLLMLCSIPVHSQGLVEIIRQTHKAVFQGISYDSRGQAIDSITGFFISADGLAITPSSILHHGDSLTFRDHNGNALRLEKIIALHPYAGLAMIQLSEWSEQKHSYLIPSNTPVGVNDNILVFGAPRDENDGLFYTKVSRSFFQLYIRRGTFIESSGLPVELHGAPVINERGRFSGILFHLGNKNQEILLPLTLLADTLWKSVDQTQEDFLGGRQKILYTHQGMVQGLLFQSTGQWIESARAFSAYLKGIPQDAELYALRAISRLNYDNIPGCVDDIGYGFHLDSNSSLTAYANALYLKKQHMYKQANDQLRLALGSNPQFAEAFLELGKLQVASGNIQEGFFSYSKATEADSMLAEAFYEKARLTQKFSASPSSALEDFQKAARLDPYLPGVFSLIGNIKINTHDYLDAIRDFNQAINMNPHDGHAYINRGLAWFNVGMKENACKDWETAGKEGMPQAFKLLSRHCSELRKSFLQNR